MMKLTCLLIAAFCAVASATSYVDFADIDTESLAKVVCKTTKGTDSQLSRPASISRLASFLSGLTSDHKLYDCRTQHLQSLEDLVHVIHTASDDVCGDEKLALIEDYHRRYVSKVAKYVKDRKKGNQAPKMVKLFFMHYVSEISNLCEKSAIQTVANDGHEFSAKDRASLEQLSAFTNTLGMTDLSKGYKGIYLFWNMVDNLDLANSGKFAKYLAERGEIRINLEMKTGLPINGIRSLCRHQLKPVYRHSILPVLRLVDMGYYPDGSQLVDELNSDSKMRSLFFAAQICETVLPIEAFSNEQLDKNDFVALALDEAPKTPEPVPAIEELSKAPEPSVVVEPVAFGADVLTMNGAPIEIVKTNVASRSKVISRLLKQSFKQLKSKFKSVFGGSKLLHKDQNQQLAPFGDVTIDENALEISEDDEAENGAARKKRRAKFWESLAVTVFAVLYVIYWIILTALKIAILTIPTIILFVICACGVAIPFNQVRAAWKWGYFL